MPRMFLLAPMALTAVVAPWTRIVGTELGRMTRPIAAGQVEATSPGLDRAACSLSRTDGVVVTYHPDFRADWRSTSMISYT